jgi:hypothetical protein
MDLDWTLACSGSRWDSLYPLVFSIPSTGWCACATPASRACCTTTKTRWRVSGAGYWESQRAMPPPWRPNVVWKLRGLLPKISPSFPALNEKPRNWLS